MSVSSIKTAAIAAGVALGSSGLIIIIGALVIGMLVLSLIPIYTSNMSADGFGEIYRIPAITIKAIYTNLTLNLNFTNAQVLSTIELSNICTSIFRAKNTKDFYACVAKNFTAYGPSGDTSNSVPSTGLRRRALDDVAMYEVGDIYILYRNTCSNRRALLKFFTRLIDGENSTCVARRATACRDFITTPNNGSSPGLVSNRWSPFPVGYSQVIVTNSTFCAPVSISTIYNVQSAFYSAVNGRFNVTITRPTGYVAGDCQLYSMLSQPDMRNFVNNQLNPYPSPCNATLG